MYNIIARRNFIIYGIFYTFLAQCHGFAEFSATIIERRTVLNDNFKKSGARNRVFEFSELVSAYYFKSSPIKEPYCATNRFSQIYIVNEGYGSFRIGDVTYPLSSGMMIYCPPDTEFTYWWESARVEYALISFVCDSEAMRVFEKGPVMLGEEEKKILIDTIITTTHICDYSKIKQPPRIEIFIKPDTPDVIIGYIYASLERFLSIVYCRLMGINIIINETQKVSKLLEASGLVNDIKEYLSSRVCEKLRIDDLCRDFGVSQTVLMEKFRNETNKTVIEYFNELKIGRAMDLIRESAGSFTEISEELGFSSISYFSKLFKKKTGMTLTEFSCLASKREALTKRAVN